MTMRTVHEVSKLTGVSVRTLHHYDSIGLLRPSSVTQAGYRLYDDTALARLQTILLFRELQFPLREIRKIIDSPDFDRVKALDSQIELLSLQRKHIDELIEFARKLKKLKGNDIMNYSAFDKKDIEKYKEEAKARWGNTEAYREFEKKTQGCSENERGDINRGLMNIFADAGKIRKTAPDSAEAVEVAKRLRGYINENFYNCTPEIFSCLADMYTAGDEMTKNIDAAGGEGTATFVSMAIKAYIATL